VSPDGRFVAYVLSGDVENVYTFDLSTGTNTQLTFDGRSADPIWSPDGKQIVYAKRDSTAAGVGSGLHLHIKAADNSGVETVLAPAAVSERATDWTHQDVIAVTATNASNGLDLVTRSPKSTGSASPYLNAPWDESGLVISPDGKLAAFSANENSRIQVWLRDFPSPTGKWLVSGESGQYPRWSRDGRYIYFWRTGTPLDTLFRSQIDRTPSVVVRTPEPVVMIDASGIANWDLFPDGKRFLLAVPDIPAAATVGPAGTDRHLVVLNWFTELKRTLGKR
jgi:Tol biopolymer transport system component